MYYVHQLFICAMFCLVAFDRRSLAENAILAKNDSAYLITTVGNILTPLLLKQVERRLMNHTPTIDGVISIEKLDSSTPMNIDIVRTNPEFKESDKSSDSLMRKFKSTTVPTTVLFPVDRVKSNRQWKVDEDKSEFDSARAQQRQLENQFPFDFRNHINIGFPGIGQQLNEEIFGNDNAFTSNQFRVLSSLDKLKSHDDILRVQGIGGSQFLGRNKIFNDPNRPLDSQILPADFKGFQNFDRIRFDGRYSNSNQFLDPNFRPETNFKGKFEVETGSRAGIGSAITDIGDRYNNFAGQLHQQNILPPEYHQNLRNNFPISATSNEAIKDRLIAPSINNQRIPIELPFRSYSNPSLNSQIINENINPYFERFPNNFPDNRNSQQGVNYTPFPSQLYFSNPPGAAVSSSFQTSIDSQALSNNNANNSGVTTSSLISSRRLEASVTKSTNNVEKVTTKIPGVESLQDRIEHEKLVLPQQDDYSDIRINPDFFKQNILESKILEKYTKTSIV